MNRCGLNQLVIDYIEGTLDAEKKTEFERHLINCSSCQRECDEYRRVFEVMGADEVPVPDAGYFEDLKRRVRQAGEKRGRTNWRIFPAVLLPAAAAAAVIFILVTNRFKSRDTVGIPVDMSALMRDANVSRLVLSRIVDSDLSAQFDELEDYVTTDIDKNIGEMSETEKDEFVKKLNEKYGRT